MLSWRNPQSMLPYILLMVWIFFLLYLLCYISLKITGLSLCISEHQQLHLNSMSTIPWCLTPRVQFDSSAKQNLHFKFPHLCLTKVYTRYEYIAHCGISMRHLLYLKFHKFINAENEEKDGKHVGSDLSPPERVQHAIECLPVSLDKELNSSSFSFRYWTILDYSRAYTSGEMTPQLVCHVFTIFLDKWLWTTTIAYSNKLFSEWTCADFIQKAKRTSELTLLIYVFVFIPSSTISISF